LIEKRFFVALHGIGGRPEGLDAQVKQLRADGTKKVFKRRRAPRRLAARKARTALTNLTLDPNNESCVVVNQQRSLPAFQHQAEHSNSSQFSEEQLMIESKFERRFPAHQNAVDIFHDHWASMIEEVNPGLTSGLAPMFGPLDRRPSIAAQYLGFVPGSLKGMNILELGPLEGAHTYQMIQLGANEVLAIEANSEAYLKCLVVKEILRMPRCRFLLGDCLAFLQETSDPFDMIFCSGILYHMENPFELIKAISQHTDRVFLWTHYFDPDVPLGAERVPKKVFFDDLKLTFYEQQYGDSSYGKFWGGNKPTASWMTKEAIELCFRYFGYDLTLHEDDRVHQGGPNIIATALRATRPA
jgi:2-polyprenyl-3-methyl-5-hydroxy-6-metoxy-1,4-benzoquinol methylase